MSLKNLTIPDVGDYDSIEVVEINIKVGDSVEKEQSLLTLETDKASMEIPAEEAGIIQEIKIKVGDKVAKGDVIGSIQISGAEIKKAPEDASNEKQQENIEPETLEVRVPDIGDYDEVNVIDINIKVGDIISKEDPIVTLETDKASMDIPSPFSGKVESIAVKVDDKISKGDLLIKVISTDTSENGVKEESANTTIEKLPEAKKDTIKEEQSSISSEANVSNSEISASPSVRRTARILGVDLSKVKATGRKGRITQDDCHDYIKKAVVSVQNGSVSSGSGLDLLPDPVVDFAKYGEIETEKLSRINKISAKNLSRNWIKIPHVTFYDEADITDLEDFRKAKKAAAEKAGVKLTPLAFLIKAAATALKEFPRFNSSLSADGENLVIKKYFHIGFAADTPKGLVVPVIKDVDKKGIFEISKEIIDFAIKGRDGKLRPEDMKGATFTISSLGVLGSTAFTPIINMPEVAIMGVSKSAIKPIWDGKGFVPRTMLPLSLSTDHRVIDGALAAKFLTRYSQVLSDLREMLL